MSAFSILEGNFIFEFVGGLIIDEMAIQSDLRIVTNGATVEFVGLVETLDESRILDSYCIM
jgi:hypothetical protein